MTWTEGAPGVVVLPDGRRVRGRGLCRGLPSGLRPEFGVYLLGRDPGPFEWAHAWIAWPDFRLPSRREQAVDVLREAFDRAGHERVEVACAGGVGRTGTSLAVLAGLSGVPGGRRVAWVRDAYDPRAVETPWQRRWAEGLVLPPGGPEPGAVSR